MVDVYGLHYFERTIYKKRKPIKKEKKKQGKEFTNLSKASLTRSHVYDTALTDPEDRFRILK